MASMKKIPTPLKQHINRFRLQALPILIFLVLLMTIGSLWNSDSFSTGGGWISGQVNAPTINIYSSYDGILMPISLTSSPSPDMLAQVDKGDIVACIDPGVLNAELSSMKAQLESLKAELQAAEVQLQLDSAERGDDKLSMIRRMSLDAERMELELLDRKTDLASSQIEAIKAESEYQRALAATDADSEDNYLLESRKHMRDYFAEQVKGQQNSLELAKNQLDKTKSRLAQLLATRDVDARTETLLAPIRHSIAAQASLVRAAEIERNTLEISSPITGHITALHASAGQMVRAGDLIMTITADYSNEVIAYVRENQQMEIGRGQTVRLRSRYGHKDDVTGVVKRVGRTMAQIPQRQWRSPDQPEFGRPVCITIDVNSGLAPGELLDINAVAAD